MLNKLEFLGWTSAGCCVILNYESKKTQIDCGINHDQTGITEYYQTHLHPDHFKLPHWNHLKKNNPNITIKTHNKLPVPHCNVDKTTCITSAYSINDEGTKLFFITDFGSIPAWAENLDLSKYDILCIECNYDEYAYKDCMNIPLHQIRSLSDSGHLSNKQCLEFIKLTNFNPNGTIVFIHPSSVKQPNMFNIFNPLPQKKIMVSNTHKNIYFKNNKCVGEI
jgi:hypothetical protein